MNVTYLQNASEFNETDELQILQSHTIDWILGNHITYKMHLYYPPRFKALNYDGLQFIFVWMCLWWFLKLTKPIPSCYVHYHSWVSAINMSMLPKTYWIICNWKFYYRINFLFHFVISITCHVSSYWRKFDIMYYDTSNLSFSRFDFFVFEHMMLRKLKL